MISSALPSINGLMSDDVISVLRIAIWSEVNMIFLLNSSERLLNWLTIYMFLQSNTDSFHRNAALGQIFRIHRAKRVFGNRHVMQARHCDVDRVWSPIELANAAETHAQRDDIAVGQGSGVWSDDVEDA